MTETTVRAYILAHATAPVTTEQVEEALTVTCVPGDAPACEWQQSWLRVGSVLGVEIREEVLPFGEDMLITCGDCGEDFFCHLDSRPLQEFPCLKCDHWLIVERRYDGLWVHPALDRDEASQP